MTDKPNRQDGDGLLPCPFCGGEAEVQELPMGIGPAMFRVRCITCTMLMPPAHFAHNAIVKWNTRIPSRDAAEGALVNVDGWRRYYDVSPKPAPDVMDTAARIIHSGAFDKETGSAHQRHEALSKAAAVFALVAPIPPADQTQQSGLYQGEPRCFYPGCGCGDLRACYPDRVMPPADGAVRTELRRVVMMIARSKSPSPAVAAEPAASEHGIECQLCGETLHDNESCDDAECPIGGNFTVHQSGTGAAEPDYADGEAPWSEDEQFSEQDKACRSRRKQYGQNHCGEKDGTCTECEYDAQKVLRKKYPAVAIPPIRGDRQVARIADEICKDPRIFTRDWNHSLEGLKAVVIERLSLPVQPAIDQTKFYAALSSHLQNDMIDIVWQAVQESGVFAGVQPDGAGEREWLPTPDASERCLTCDRTDAEYANGTRSCNDPWHGDDHLRRPLSRQAPHSSSERET